MNPLKSVGARLGLGLAIVVAAALILVDLIVVPSLEQNLIDAKLQQLSEVAPSVGSQLLNSSSFTIDETIQSAAASADARVIYFQVLSFNPPRLSVYADSNTTNSADVENDALAFRAFSQARTVRGTVSSGDSRYAEVAYPVFGGPILLLRAPLHDSLRSIDLVRSRLVVAGLIALAASLLVGYLAASVFARRIRRLERAADRIASGDFDEPVVDAGKDELGELAAAFERMRLRLAQLEHARREFVANASHELRTPLFSLGGFLELIDDGEVDAKTQSEFVSTMREQVARLTKLATELLDLSRLDAGRLAIEREAVDLAELAETLADEFRAVARSTDHDLTVAPGRTPTALADEERVLQIGRILVENALIHTPPGTPVQLRTEEGGEGQALLIVEDDGPGIPAEHAGQIFDRFYRGDGSKASGSGLGLAIARELAERMNGSIELESRAGRTRFALMLPSTRTPPFPRENEKVEEPSLQ